jgi:hypothetical protein
MEHMSDRALKAEMLSIRVKTLSRTFSGMAGADEAT